MASWEGLAGRAGLAALGVAAAATAIGSLASPAAPREPLAGGDPVQVQRGLRYAPSAAAELDVYRRRTAAGAAVPGVLVVHGGGWRHGDKRRMVGVARSLAAAGFVAFNVNYTLASWAHPGYRRQPAELRAAVRWVRRNAGRLGVDPQRLGALGSSAGAHLVGLLALGGDGPLGRGSRLRAAVTWSAPFDLMRPGAPGLPGAIDTFLGCVLRPCDLRRAAASPVNHASPDDPPMLIVNSEHELVPLGHATEMAARLAAAGVEHRLWVLPGDRHARAYAATAMGPSIAFLRERLR